MQRNCLNCMWFDEKYPFSCFYKDNGNCKNLECHEFQEGLGRDLEITEYSGLEGEEGYIIVEKDKDDVLRSLKFNNIGDGYEEFSITFWENSEYILNHKQNFKFSIRPEDNETLYVAFKYFYDTSFCKLFISKDYFGLNSMFMELNEEEIVLHFHNGMLGVNRVFNNVTVILGDYTSCLEFDCVKELYNNLHNFSFGPSFYRKFID